jgi:hypothetical protein
MARRWRRAVMGAVAGLVSVLAPLVAARPADATDVRSQARGRLTFVNSEGLPSTCTLDLNVLRSASRAYIAAGADTYGTTGDCVDPVRLDLTIAYEDQGGRAHEVHLYGYAIGFSGVEVRGAVSAVRVVLNAVYYDCDANASASCEMNLTLAPK